MAATQARGLGALLMIVVGVWFFLQVSVGEMVERLQSFVPGGKEPEKTMAPSSAFMPSKSGRKALRLGPLAKRGDPVVYNTIAVACSRAGGGFIATSWHRPGAKVAGTDRLSCHSHGKGTGKGALDIVHESGDWGPVDKLEYELKAMAVGEVLFRGVPGHDPALEKDDPHLHGAVNCG